MSPRASTRSHLQAESVFPSGSTTTSATSRRFKYAISGRRRSKMSCVQSGFTCWRTPGDSRGDHGNLETDEAFLQYVSLPSRSRFWLLAHMHTVTRFEALWLPD